jgi:3-oxoacyl-[acyl-carrier-protein] synthase II
MVNKIVITGLGMINPLGHTCLEVYNEYQDKTNSINQGISHYDPTNHFEKKEINRLDSFSQYAIVAANEAIEQAKLSDYEGSMEEISVIIGASGNGADRFLQENHELLIERGPKRISPYYSSAAMINSPPAEIALKNGFQGPSAAVLAGETSGLLALGQAVNYIQNGSCTIAIAGGTQGDISLLTETGYEKSAIISEYPHHPLNPGAGAVVIETEKEARRRGAEPIGEVISFSMTTVSDEAEVKEAMLDALAEANIETHMVDLIGVAEETDVVTSIFKQDVEVLSLKESMGNTLAASGVNQVILSLLSLKETGKKEAIGLVNCIDPAGHFGCLIIKVV